MIGSALEMSRDPTAFMLRQYRALGPIFELRLGPRRVTALAGPEAVRFALQTGYRYLASGRFWAPFLAEFEAESFLLSKDGPAHRHRRNLLKPGYARGALHRRFDHVITILRTHLSAVVASSRVGRGASVTPLLQRALTDVLGRVLANYDFGDRLDDLLRYHTTLMMVTAGARPSLALLAPGHRRRRRRVLAAVDEILREHRERARAEPDFIDIILEAQARAPKQAPEFSDAELTLVSIGPFFAGKDTAALTCGFLLWALLEDPSLLQRARAESDALFSAGAPAPEAIDAAPTLSGVTTEALRRYPVSPMIPRTAARDFDFAGYRVPAGRELLVMTAVSHFLPRFYPAPARFDIDRYRVGADGDPLRELKRKGAFAPFGVGPHLCLGAAFAQSLIKLTVATLLHHYDIELDPPGYQLRTILAPGPTPAPDFRVRLRERR